MPPIIKFNDRSHILNFIVAIDLLKYSNMKKTFLPFVILIASLLSLPAFSQNNDEPVALGLPGDNLNLYAVLEVFQKSPTLEGFEKSLNDKEIKINNLDLNNDKFVDYIKVVNIKDGNAHSVILRVAINEKENQDLAVIEIAKDAAGNVSVQIIGDEELYGKNYVIEPCNNKVIGGIPNPAYLGTKSDFFYANNWPVVVYLFTPGFMIYNSPWYWGYYPSYWSPWMTIGYYDYWSFYYPYYTNSFYRRVAYIRHPVHYLSYTRIRNTSAFMIQNRNSGNYNATYNGKIYKKPVVPVTRKVRKVTPQIKQKQTPPLTNRKKITMPAKKRNN